MTTEIEGLVRGILRNPRVRGKIVVLCEGDPLRIPEGAGAPSPQMYSRLERTPDASFYAACVSRSWQGLRLPCFFTCGGRSQVLSIFDALRQEHEREPKESYLDPGRLFALVDLDLCAQPLPPPGDHETTEHAHEALYDDGLLRPDIPGEPRVWITALVHKEAFFILPGTDAVWRDRPPYYRGAPLVLRDLHAHAADSITVDPDLAAHWLALQGRVSRFPSAALDERSPEQLRDSWHRAAQRATADTYPAIVRGLFAFAKAKQLWHELEPPPGNGPMPSELYRDQLELKIGEHISKLEPTEHSLAAFFAWLKPRR